MPDTLHPSLSPLYHNPTAIFCSIYPSRPLFRGMSLSSADALALAVVYHHGSSASGGHYTVSVSRQDAGGWIHFDDENVSTIPVDQVVVSEQEARDGRSGVVGPGMREKCAYLLFYLRVRA